MICSRAESACREIDQRRAGPAEPERSPAVHCDTLRLVDPAPWTAHEDLAALAGTTAEEVADFLASGQNRLANAYRVLNADGSIPPEGMLNATYRSFRSPERLAEEGVEFDDGWTGGHKINDSPPMP